MHGRPRNLGLGWMPAFPEEEITDEELHAAVAYGHALRARTSRGRPNL